MGQFMGDFIPYPINKQIEICSFFCIFIMFIVINLALIYDYMERPHMATKWQSSKGPPNFYRYKSQLGKVLGGGILIRAVVRHFEREGMSCFLENDFRGEKVGEREGELSLAF